MERGVKHGEERSNKVKHGKEGSNMKKKVRRREEKCGQIQQLSVLKFCCNIRTIALAFSPVKYNRNNSGKVEFQTTSKPLSSILHTSKENVC